jgi:hypothetical protein
MSSLEIYIMGSLYILFKEERRKAVVELEFVHREMYSGAIFPGTIFSQRCYKYANQRGHDAMYVGKYNYQFSEKIFANIFRVDWEDFDVSLSSAALF